MQKKAGNLEQRRLVQHSNLAAISAAIVQADALALTNAAAAQNCALTLHVRNDRLFFPPPVTTLPEGKPLKKNSYPLPGRRFLA